VIIAAARVGRQSVSLEMLERGFVTHDMHVLDAALETAADKVSEVFADALPGELTRVLNASGQAAATAATRSSGGFRAADRIGVSFKKTNPRAVAWAETRSATLVTRISEETRGAIREVVRSAFETGVPPKAAARLIRPLIGLTERDAQAVINLRQRLLDSPGDLVYAGKTRIRVPREGASEEFLGDKADEYADRLLNGRAVSIARTETIAASNEGQRELWLQAVDEGLLDENEQREWITAGDDRLCPICESMDGQVRGLAEPFETPDGEEVMGPPAHPMCRCAQGITERQRQEERAASNECHDVNGQFCETGGGTGSPGAVAKHPNEREGRKMVRGWVSDSNSKVGVTMKLAIREELGAKGAVFDPEKAAGRVSSKDLLEGRKGVRAIYDTTQETLIRSGIGSEIVLYRGIDKPRARRNVVESWTSDLNVARSFGAHVMQITVRREQILAYHGSPIWSNQHKHEKEFVVLPGLTK